MNLFLKTRMTQVAALLLLSTWWLTSTQSASAMPLPAPDSDGPATISAVTPAVTPAVTAPTTVVVHGHTSFWVYAAVALLAVVATLVVVGLLRWARQLGSARRKALPA